MTSDAVLIQHASKPSSALNTVSVCCELNESDGVHVGFLYERENGSTWRCDVAWDLIARNEAVSASEFSWVNINLRSEVLELLAAFLEEGMEQNLSVIPYDVRYLPPPHAYFDLETSRYTSSIGLTCATFILAVLRRLNLELFDVAAWPSRDEDGAVFEKYISHLERRCADTGRIAAMRANHENRRFRPEEVCASVGLTDWPVPFATASRAGLTVLENLIDTRQSETASATVGRDVSQTTMPTPPAPPSAPSETPPADRLRLPR